jgi:hypothetical protein
LTLPVLALALVWSVAAPAAATPSHARNPVLDVEGLNHACGVAVDSKGDLYASSAGAAKILIFAPADHETPIGEIANANPTCSPSPRPKAQGLARSPPTAASTASTPAPRPAP